MISTKYRYIYYHITKNGGTSIENALLKLENVQQKIPYVKMHENILKKFNLGFSKQHCLPESYPDVLKRIFYLHIRTQSV